MEENKYLSYDGLVEYTDLVKKEIDNAYNLSFKDSKDYTDAEITKITDGTVTVKKAEHSSIADSATVANKLNSVDVGSVNQPIYLEDGVATKVTAVGTPYGGTGATTVVGARSNLDVYSTTEVDKKLSTKSDSAHNHDSKYDTKGAADAVLNSSKSYTDDKIDAIVGEGASETLNTIGEISAAIEDNQDMIDILNSAIGNKVDKVSGKSLSTNDLTAALKNNYDAAYTHTSNKSNPHGVTLSQLGVNATATELNYVDGVTSNIQSQLNSKANSSHGTHVSYSTTAPVMDGTASAGSASTVARSDHKHPTDTSRASQADLDILEEVVGTKVDKVSGKGLSTNDYTTTEKNKLAGIASGAEVNQNAFSNVTVGSTTIAADGKQDTLTIASGGNITITPDASADKVTFTVADGTTGAKGVVQLTNSTSSTSTTTAATPNSVKSAYDLANTAKTTADSKQAKITGAATTITGSNLTASRALVSDASGKVAVSSVTSTQLGYLSGVTSAIQTQLNGKLSTSGTAAKANSVKGKLSIDVDQGASGGATSLVYDGSQDLNLSISASPLDHTHSGYALTSHTHSSFSTISIDTICNESGTTNHSVLFGKANRDKFEIYEYGGEFNLYRSVSGTNTKILGVSPSAFTYNGNTVIHSGNYSSYCAPASHTHNYVPYANGVGSVSAGIALGNSNPYIYTENNNINFRWYWNNAWRYYSMEDIYNKLVAGGAITHGYLTIANDAITSSTNSVSLKRNGSSTDGFMVAGNCRPLADNSMTSGSSSYRWKQLYAATTTINTSDRNAKRDFRTFDSNENYEKFFMDLKPLVFKFKDGESGRDHFGFVSQDVEDSLYKYNFDDKSFAGFCKDVKVEYVEDEYGNGEEIPVLDENGNKQYIYGLRYGEFTAFNTYMIQKLVKENQELKENNKELHAKNEKLEARLQAIEKMLEKLDVAV